MLLGSGGDGGGPAEVFVCAAGRGRGARAVAVRAQGGAGVDLGPVGRALGLDPSTLRLNGHYLSRGPHFVSCVTWAALQAFFAARALPAGRSVRDSIQVHGKPLPAELSSHSDEANGSCLSFKRKAGLEDVSLPKKNRPIECNSGVLQAGDRQVSDDDCLSIKRKLRLEDDNPFKKIRTNEYNSGFAEETPKFPTAPARNGIMYSCVNGHGKRLREEEMVTAMPCKRIK